MRRSTVVSEQPVCHDQQRRRNTNGNWVDASVSWQRVCATGRVEAIASRQLVCEMGGDGTKERSGDYPRENSTPATPWSGLSRCSLHGMVHNHARISCIVGTASHGTKWESSAEGWMRWSPDKWVRTTMAKHQRQLVDEVVSGLKNARYLCNQRNKTQRSEALCGYTERNSLLLCTLVCSLTHVICRYRKRNQARAGKKSGPLKY